MSTRLDPVRIADDLFEFEISSAAAAQALAAHLRQRELAEDVVAGLDRVAVRFDPARIKAVSAWLSEVQPVAADADSTAAAIDIGIHYGGEHGPDLDLVCTALDLTRDAFIAAHTAPTHTVEMIGFTPGFAYISGLPDGFSVPRLAAPRPRVPAGSVGISAAFTGIYALHGPGGWPLIGRTDATLFDATRAAPFLLQPGQRVRFRAR